MKLAVLFQIHKGGIRRLQHSNAAETAKKSQFSLQNCSELSAPLESNRRTSEGHYRASFLFHMMYRVRARQKRRLTHEPRFADGIYAFRHKKKKEREMKKVSDGNPLKQGPTDRFSLGWRAVPTPPWFLVSPSVRRKFGNWAHQMERFLNALDLSRLSIRWRAHRKHLERGGKIWKVLERTFYRIQADQSDCLLPV